MSFDHALVAKIKVNEVACKFFLRFFLVFLILNNVHAQDSVGWLAFLGQGTKKVVSLLVQPIVACQNFLIEHGEGKQALIDNKAIRESSLQVQKALEVATNNSSGLEQVSRTLISLDERLTRSDNFLHQLSETSQRNLDMTIALNKKVQSAEIFCGLFGVSFVAYTIFKSFRPNKQKVLLKKAMVYEAEILIARENLYKCLAINQNNFDSCNDPVSKFVSLVGLQELNKEKKAYNKI